MERAATFLFIHVGATIAHAEGIEAVPANMLEVRPTIVVSVPRLFEKIYARVMDQILAEPWLKRVLFFGALAVGKKRAAKVVTGKIAVLDRDFELELGEVTPTLKVKRNVVEQKYADLIESLYQS